MDNKEIMAKNIKRRLEAKGINVKDFANQLGFKYTTVLDWVNAKTYPRIDKIEKMANYFNINKSELIEADANRDPIVDNDADLDKMLDNARSFDRKLMSENDRNTIKQLIKDYWDSKNKE